jgi:hypothetical protein
MKLLAALAFLGMFSTNALANGCDAIKTINGISNEEKQAMVVACEQKKLAAVGATAATPVDKVAEVLNKDTMTEISAIAKVAGQTVKEVAAELNVAVNDFIKTPVGMLTAGLAVWYVAGDTIESVFESVWDTVGGIFIILVATIAYRKFVKYATLDTIETKLVKGWFGSEKEVEVRKYRTWDSLRFESGDELLVIISVVWAFCMVIGLLWIF